MQQRLAESEVFDDEADGPWNEDATDDDENIGEHEDIRDLPEGESDIPEDVPLSSAESDKD